jgi:hypothetical protein
MSILNQVATMNGMFKEFYADKMSNLLPDGVRFLKDIAFSERNKLGKSYNVPVLLQMEHGVSFLGSDDEVLDLEEAVAAATRNASVKGSVVVLRSKISITALSRAANGDKASFIEGTKYVVENMVQSIAKKLEILMVYGGSGLGTIAADATIDTTGVVVTIPVAEFAPGIWAGAKGLKLDAFNAAGSTRKTTNGNYLEVVAVDLEARQLTLKCVSGTIALLATDVLWFFKAKTVSALYEFKGIHHILDYSGTDLFGIDNTQFELFKAPEYNSAGALSLTKINEAISLAIAKGLDGDVTVYCSNATWDAMMTQMDALRSFDSSYDEKKGMRGHKAIEFYSKNGMIRVVPSIHVKNGYAYILNLDCWERVGSSDVSFKIPGRGDEFFETLENSQAVQLRAFSDFAVFCHKPGQNVLVRGIS